ncbi:Vps53-like protein [Cladochytrium replicatum]|nr:Vps53-like protein [Cladochytrium replicatum]
MAPTPVDGVGPILDSPLDSNDFNPVQLINAAFPNEQSLASIDLVLSKLRAQVTAMDRELRTLLASQTDAGAQSAAELQHAQQSIMALYERIRKIKESAEQSERMVLEITQDIKSLDHSKKNLSVTLTVLKRLQMLLVSSEQLKQNAARKQYLECSELVQIARHLLIFFKPYRSVHRIASLYDYVVNLQVEIRRQIFRDFEGAFVGGGLKNAVQKLRESCTVIEVMEPEHKKQLTDWYCDSQLKDYRSIFRNNPEVAGLDNITRRHAWLKRLLKLYDEEHAQVFPPEWNVGELLCEKFCQDTRKDLVEVLAKTDNNMDVKVMLQALQSTLDFEGKLSQRFNGPATSATQASFLETDDGGAVSSSTESVAPQVPGSKFQRIMSEAFEPYLRHHINAEDKTIQDMVDGYRSKPIVPADEESVLQSSTDLFMFYRQSMLFFSKMSVGKPFWDLSRMFGKWLRAYADVLTAKFPKEDKKSFTDDDFVITCLVINTADYCYSTTSQLEEKLQERIDPAFKTMVNFSNESDTFLSVAANGVRVLVRGVENGLDPSLNLMTRKQWGGIQSVGDQSDYINQIATSLRGMVGTIKSSIPASNSKYFKNFCDKFAESFLARFHGSIFKCRPISEVGAEQMLLDTHALKTILTQMINVNSEESVAPPQTYIKILTKGVSRVEQLLKVVMNPVDPPEQLISTYMALFNDPSVANFIKAIELKGLKRPEIQALVEVFQQQVGVDHTAPTGLPLSNNNALLGSTAPGIAAFKEAFSSSSTAMNLGGSTFKGFQGFGVGSSNSNSTNTMAQSLSSDSGSGTLASAPNMSTGTTGLNAGSRSPAPTKAKEDFGSFMLRKMTLKVPGATNNSGSK